MLTATKYRHATRLAIRCFLVTALAIGATYSAVAQPQTAQFGLDSSEASEPSSLPPERQRGYDLEQCLRESEDWTFYHSISDLPSDMRAVLFSVAGSEVVGSGEPFTVGDILEYPSNTQHLYTAVTDELGVVVWYSGGLGGVIAYAVIYDREVRDAAHYFLGKAGSVVLRLRDLAGLIQARRGTRGRYEYLPPDFFADQ